MLISLISNKGGIGKSTISLNLAISLARLNKKTLLVDLDALGSTLFDFNKTYADVKNKTIWDVLQEKEQLANCVVTLNEKLDLLCSNTILKKWDSFTTKNDSLSDKLAYLLKFLNDVYDYVIIDTSPQMSLLNETIIKNSNMILIPFATKQKDMYATFATLSLLNSFNLNNVPKLLVQNYAKSNSVTNEIKLSKAEQVLYNYLNEFLLSLDNKDYVISKNFISNSSLLDKTIITKELPITATEMNAKPIRKIKDQFITLAREVMNYIK